VRLYCQLRIGSHTPCFSLDSASAVVQRNFAFHFCLTIFARQGGVEGGCTDKKENQIFLIYKEIQSGAVDSHI
jgi:hypothetical protein